MTKQTKHTPGPWKLVGMEIWAGSKRVTMGKGSFDESDRACRKANARLISAAPDLLEAGKNILNFLEKYPHQHSIDIIDFQNQLKQAIAKAEGKTE